MTWESSAPREQLELDEREPVNDSQTEDFKPAEDASHPIPALDPEPEEDEPPRREVW
jgi:hypothetical protein